MSDHEAKRTLGSANYKAEWVSRTNLVKLTATGILPCANYEAQLEERPERVIPPMWDMIFYVTDFCLKALKPFEKSVYFEAPNDTRSIFVRDASGEHEVPVSDVVAEVHLDSVFGDAGGESDLYSVFAKLPKEDSGHYGCTVLPADSIVLAIYYTAFGPASKEECDQFLVESCRGERSFELAAGEIPWPLIVRGS